MDRGERGFEGAPEFEVIPEDVEVVSDSDIVREGLTYDDVTIRQELSDVRHQALSLQTRLTRGIELNIPFLSAAMDTVTEHRLATALAREGGAGVIHKNLSIEDQVDQVERVKRTESALIEHPVTLPPDAPVSEVRRIREERGIGSVLVIDENRLVGLVAKRQLRFTSGSESLRDVMKPLDRLAVLPEGSTRDDAERYLREHKDEEVDHLPVVDAEGRLKGLFTFKDIVLRTKFPHAAKDAKGRLVVGAAIGVEANLEDALTRVDRLIKVGADFFTADSAHGGDAAVIALTREIKHAFPDLQLVAGNVGSRSATRELVEAGADAIKIGIGPGASCTTRKVTGVGTSQLAAIKLALQETRGEIPVIADGGIRYSGDAGKALVAGADAVMMGSIFAGVEESPGETVLQEGRKFKAYRGMGSEGGIRESRGGGRYYSGERKAVVPEGIEGVVPYSGTLAEVVAQYVGGIEKSMYYTGSESVPVLQRRGKFQRVSPAAQAESHPHDMTITREAPNYSGRR
ncbi:MAG: IMP dehydrogenase [Patescibacteria group bacterium]